MAKFYKGEYVWTNHTGGIILDVWFANTNLFCDFEYKIRDKFGSIVYIREKDILTQI